MPRDYDPDFDDTPPPSPKIVSRPSLARQTLFRLRRSRGVVYALCALLAFWIYENHHPGPLFKPKHAPSLTYKDVDWRQFAYAQYAANGQYLCSAVMQFDALTRLGSKAQKILVYSEHMDTDVMDNRDRDSQLLVLARDTYGAILIPVPHWTLHDEADLDLRTRKQDASAMGEIFNQTQFSRIIYFDADSVLRQHTDNLFLLPSSPVAMPRAYWKLPDTKSLAPSFMVVEPSEDESARIIQDYNLARLYSDSAMVLPHRQFALISGEFRVSQQNHSNYFGNDFEQWDPDRALRGASIVHFADWPLEKPWVMWSNEALQDIRPSCEGKKPSGAQSCRDREIWMDLYDGFRRRRKEVCGLLSVPAPKWPPKKPDR